MSDENNSLDAAAAAIADMDRAPPQSRDERGRYVAGRTGDAGGRHEGEFGNEFDDFDAESDAENTDEFDDETDLQESGEDDSQEADPSDERKYEVVVDGETQEVGLADLIKAYQIDASLTQRQQAFSNERKAFEPQRQQVLAERQAYTHLLGQVAGFLAEQAPSEEAINQLMLQDPVEGWRAKQVRDQIMAKAQEFFAGYQDMTRGAQAMQQRARAENMQAAVAQLPVLIPEWRNQELAARERTAIGQVMVEKWGFTVEELNEIDDPRAMVIARKAWLYDRMIAQKGKAFRTGKIQNTPRPLPPGSKQPARPTNERRTQAIADRARKSGTIEDAAAWILETEMRPQGGRRR
jgi:hypothetical protein